MITIIYEKESDIFSFGDNVFHTLGEVSSFVCRWFPAEKDDIFILEKGESK